MRIYLDHNATTPLRAEVLERMGAVLRDVPGNPSSTHAEGAAARRVVEEAREAVAACLDCAPREVVFTAGATEANNTVLHALRGPAPRWSRLVTTAVEHPSVREPAARLEREGIAVRWLPVDAAGLVDPAALDAALREDGGAPALVAILWANNETGALQPIEALAAVARAHGSALHVDATQALGKVEVSLPALGADFVSCSAHKLNGPKGTGALVVRGAGHTAEPLLPPLVSGGPQERRARGGTENVAGIAGFAVACALARAELGPRAARYRALRDRLFEALCNKLDGLHWNAAADGAAVLPNTLNLEFAGAAGDVLLQALDLDGVAVSAGAACHSGSIDPSHVLLAMGRTAEQARASLRLSVGEGNDEAQIDAAARRIVDAVPRARAAARA